jgi:O-antigen/teichoic acid export membrane protein
MFPMISDLMGRNEKHYRLLAQSFGIVTLIGLIGVGGYYLLPNFVIKVLYGSDYISIAPLLGIFGITMLLYSYINLWVNYFLSIGNKGFVWVLLAPVIAELVLLWMYHDTFVSVVNSLLISMIIGMVGLTGYYFSLKKQQLTKFIKERYVHLPMAP